jgi:hypothetical protein
MRAAALRRRLFSAFAPVEFLRAEWSRSMPVWPGSMSHVVADEIKEAFEGRFEARVAFGSTFIESGHGGLAVKTRTVDHDFAAGAEEDALLEIRIGWRRCRARRYKGGAGLAGLKPKAVRT